MNNSYNQCTRKFMSVFFRNEFMKELFTNKKNEEEEKINKEIFSQFCFTMETFTDIEIENIITRLVDILQLKKEKNIKENWKNVFHKILD